MAGNLWIASQYSKHLCTHMVINHRIIYKGKLRGKNYILNSGSNVTNYGISM